MTFEQVVKHFGSEVEAAKKLGFTRQAVNLWKANGIQPRTQEYIQMKTRGKLKADKLSRPRRTHGMSYTRVYKCWISMRNRCEKQWCAAYPNYGGRGIKVCVRWSKFENFYADMGPMPKGYCIDRIDNNGHYTPKNCRWTTKAEGNRNKRTVKRVVFKGKTQLLL